MKSIIYLHTVEGFWVLLFIVCTQLNSFKYNKWLNSSVRSIDKTLTCTSTPGQSKPGSNSNEGVLHILQSSRTGASPSNSLISYPGYLVQERRSYPSAKLQSAYSTALDKWAEPWLGSQSRRRKTKFKPALLHLKIDLVSHILSKTEGSGKYLLHDFSKLTNRH